MYDSFILWMYIQNIYSMFCTRLILCVYCIFTVSVHCQWYSNTPDLVESSCLSLGRLIHLTPHCVSTLPTLNSESRPGPACSSARRALRSTCFLVPVSHTEDFICTWEIVVSWCKHSSYHCLQRSTVPIDSPSDRNCTTSEPHFHSYSRNIFLSLPLTKVVLLLPCTLYTLPLCTWWLITICTNPPAAFIHASCSSTLSQLIKLRPAVGLAFCLLQFLYPPLKYLQAFLVFLLYFRWVRCSSRW